MDTQDLASLRAAFIGLVLPRHTPTSSCYLSSAAVLSLSAKSFIEVNNLTVDDFPDPEDFQRAVTSDTLWSWEEKSPTGNTTHHLVASSLPALLGHLGVSENQVLACTCYEDFFGKFSLCFNDFQDAGWETARGFIEDNGGAALFLGDEQDMSAASSSDQVWTVVDVEASKTLIASSRLDQVLAKAWDTHPIIARRTHLQAHVSASTRPSGRRF